MLVYQRVPAQSSPTLAKHPSNICSHNIEFTAFPTKEILRYKIHQKSGFRQPAKGDPPIPDDEDSPTFFRLLVVAVHYLEYVLDVNPTW